MKNDDAASGSIEDCAARHADMFKSFCPPIDRTPTKMRHEAAISIASMNNYRFQLELLYISGDEIISPFPLVSLII